MRVGKREPRERVLWGGMGGRETLTVPAPGEGLGRLDSPAVPPTLAPSLGDMDDRLVPRDNLSRRLDGVGKPGFRFG